MNNIEQEKFFEGQMLDFKVIRVIVLNDNNEYFLLESPAGNRYMMRKSYYENYNIKKDSVINCRIDKINCNGKIFLEPKHPVYVSNQKYDFKVIDTFSEKNIYDIDIHGYIVEDVLKNKINVVCNIQKNTPDYLNCYVIRIKKGIPLLSLKDVAMYKDNVIKCKIIDKITNAKGMSFFAVIDNVDGSKHYINTDNYNDFDFQLGDEINCFVIDIDKYSNIILEPFNPFYEIENKYEFCVKGWIEENGHFGEKRNVLVVKDKFGKDAHVYFDKIDENIFKKYSENENIICTVVRYKKGGLQLKID